MLEHNLFPCQSTGRLFFPLELGESVWGPLWFAIRRRDAKRTINAFNVTAYGRPVGPSIRSTTTCSVERGIGSACATSAVVILSDPGLLRLGATRLKT